MDLESVALEAVKVKIQEIFNKVMVNAALEGRDIVIRIGLPDEIMNNKVHIQEMELSDKQNLRFFNKDLDKDAQAAADELLGTQPFIAQE